MKVPSSSVIMVLSIFLFVGATLGLVAYYPKLPDRVAIHFDWNFKPDRYVSKPAFVITYFFNTFITFAITVILSYLALRESLALRSIVREKEHMSVLALLSFFAQLIATIIMILTLHFNLMVNT